MSKPIYLSKKALEDLRAELHTLKFVKRPEVSKAIETARLHGDLSENAEYDAAKEEMQHLEGRIANMEITLASARPLEEMDIPDDTCYLGATVTLEDLDDGSEETYQLVSPPEADPRLGNLSVESPIGKGLLGKRAGEEVSIEIPAGVVRYRVIAIERQG
jgi:transcription elongation factor GreA